MENFTMSPSIKKKKTRKMNNVHYETSKEKKQCLDSSNKAHPNSLDKVDMMRDSINIVEFTEKLNLYKNTVEENDNIIKSLSENKTKLLTQNSLFYEKVKDEENNRNCTKLIINELQNGICQVHAHQNILVDKLNILEERRVGFENTQQKVFSKLNNLRNIGDSIITEKNKQHEQFLNIYNTLELKHKKQSIELEKLNEKCLTLNEFSHTNHKLNDELKKLKNEIHNKEIEYELFVENQKRLNEDYIKSLNEIEIMKANNTELMQINNILEETIKQSNEKMHQLETQNMIDKNSIRNDLDGKNANLDLLKKKTEMMHQANDNLNQLLERSLNEYENLKMQLQELKTNYEKEINCANNELHELKNANKEGAEQIVKMNSYCSSLHTKIEVLEAANKSSFEIIENLKADNQTLMQDIKKKNCDIYSLSLEIEKINNKKDKNDYSKSISQFINKSSLSSIGSISSCMLQTDSITKQDPVIQTLQRQVASNVSNFNCDSDSSMENKHKKANYIPQNVLQKKFFNNAGRFGQQNTQISIIDRIRFSQQNNAAAAAMKDNDKIILSQSKRNKE